MGSVSLERMESLANALSTTAYTSGSTHHFYHYPARFHPEIAREVISSFSRKGDLVLDPFMGGGTSVVEALSLGRRVLGCDINALARFVAEVRTRPLSGADRDAILHWADRTARRLTMSDLSWVPRPGVRNLPRATETFISGALELSERMLPRRRDFARAALLRLGQWALDCRDFQAPRRRRLAERLPEFAAEMLDGLDVFVQHCAAFGVAKNGITGRRLLLHRTAVGLDEDRHARRHLGQPRLVFTSPPYPGVHVLYHRWQYRGRQETDAPYWIANAVDGSGTSYYCGGSRTPTGLRNYFEMIRGAFCSLARLIHPDATVVQIVGFSRVDEQLPLYLAAMRDAGFREIRTSGLVENRLTRRVANRKWYAKLQGDVDASTEYLLVHRLR